MKFELTRAEANVCADALSFYADNRMKLARKRDKNEMHLTGASVEAALSEFFVLCRSAKQALRVPLPPEEKMNETWRTRWLNSRLRFRLRWLLGPGDHGWAIYWNGEPAPNWMARLVMVWSGGRR